MRTPLVLCVAFVAALGSASLSSAQGEEVVLVELGRFDRVFEAADGFGMETHYVSWDERFDATMEDANLLPGICSEGRGLGTACVRQIRIDIRTKRPYAELFLVYQRAGSEVDEILFDNRKVGTMAVGSFVVTDGAFADVSFRLGMVTPRKTHTLIIRSPDNGGASGFHLVGGIKLVAVPLGAGQGRWYRATGRAVNQ